MTEKDAKSTKKVVKSEKTAKNGEKASKNAASGSSLGRDEFFLLYLLSGEE